jgi:hypothetical protein
MKNIITLILANLFISGFTYAQVSKESYEKAIDFLNCKTVELSLIKDKNLSDFQKKCPCELTEYTDINEFLDFNNYDLNITLSNEINSLKNIYRNNWTNEDIINFLTDSIFNEKLNLKNLITFAQNKKRKDDFNIYKSNLKSDLSKILSVNDTDDSFTPTLEERIVKLEAGYNDETKNYSILGNSVDYFVLFTLLLGIVAIYLSLRKRNVNAIYKAILPNILESKRIKELIQSLNNSKVNTPTSFSFNSNELRDVNNRIRDLELQVKNLTENINTSIATKTNNSMSFYQELKQSDIRNEIFFLSTPNSDGSFNESSASSFYKDGATIYRFTKIGPNKAKFLIDEKEASVKLALEYPDKNIDPVCDAVNAFNPKATRITTVEQGEAELQHGKWVVEKNKKGKIKYEN